MTRSLRFQAGAQLVSPVTDACGRTAVDDEAT